MSARDGDEHRLAAALRLPEVPPGVQVVVAVSPRLARTALLAVMAGCSVLVGVRWGTGVLVVLYVALMAAVVYGALVERHPRADRYTVRLVGLEPGEDSGPLPALYRFPSRRAVVRWIADNSTGDLATWGLRWEPVDLWVTSGASHASPRGTRE